MSKKEKSEVQRLKDALVKYGSHEPNCPKEAMPMRSDDKCTCGFSAALKQK